MNILLLNGPNINLIGTREPEIYGSVRYPEIVAEIQAHCRARSIEVDVRQTNHEGVLVDWIQSAAGLFDGLVINPAAYTHTSVALLDAVQAVRLPTVEIHLSDPDRREDFRRVSYIRAACVDTVSGMGWRGYLEAIDRLVKYINRQPLGASDFAP